MQPADDTTKDALAAGERTLTHGTRLGGEDVSAQVQSWQVERAYATDLPSAMRSFAGSSAAQLQLQVAGRDGRGAPALYSPWAPRATGDIARPGQSVVHTAGVGGAALPAFRGTIRSRSAVSGTDSVELTALDGAERLRGPAQLPRPYTGVLRRRPVATATWCVDELLRQAGMLTSPPPRGPEFVPGKPLTLVHATLHGGFATPYGMPEDLPDPRHYTWTRAGAPHEMAFVPTALPPGQERVTASWFPRARVTVPGNRIFVEAWVNNALGVGDQFRIDLILNRKGTTTGRLALEVDFQAGTYRLVSAGEQTGGLSLPWDVAWLREQRGVWHFGAFFDTVASGGTVLPTVQPCITTPTGHFWRGNALTFADDRAAQTASELRLVRMESSVGVEGLQVTSGLAATPDEAGFSQAAEWTKAAELDDAILPLRVIPQVSGSQWEAITGIAKASLSTAEVDEHGWFRWRNFTRFQTAPTAPDLTLTSVREIASLTVTEEIDACRNYCVQPAKDWSGVKAVVSSVTEDDRIREIPPYSSLTLSYTFDESELDIGPPDTDDDSGIAGSRFRVARQNAAGLPPVKGMVDALLRREDGAVVLRLANRGPDRLYTVTKEGGPSIRIVGIKADRDPVERHGVSYVPGSVSERFYGRQEYFAEATDWVQELDSARHLAAAMRTAGELPVPVLADVQVLYDPRVQLGDVVRIQDTSGARLDTLAWVVGITTAATADGGVQQTLSLRGTRPNGVPQDSGLTPDPPAAVPPRPPHADYAAVKRTHPSLQALRESRATWRSVKENS
ncbi:hypothetical protein, partial [Streptomyces spectabilis]